ncbi:hypothetical protein RND71_001730 [Anisodus tanguticus]|uniref:FAF domain-containing protein n=1 Tax=Anisodus tanguticus TaxID=243964 RepID=A0AAE1VRB2_9SOLA|nr:hypothetical protein RND71_001730 [Anisodus tanguticus]
MSMSTIVYQGTLQSCFESQIIETTTLKLKVPSTIEFGRGPCLIENNIDNLKEKCNYQITNKPSTTNPDLGGGWSFLQNLSNISSKDSNLEKENDTYVHPLSKRSSYSSRLSEKSLQLCTESLGSETGTDIIDTSIFSFSSSYSRIEKTPSSSDNMMTHQAESSPPPTSSSSTWTRSSTSMKKCCSKFPPPLTTIRGLNSMQIRPHREDGRLIIKAVEAPLTHTYLQAERSNGRLRLSFFNDKISASSNIEENEELEEIENDIIINDEVKEEIEEKKDDTKEEEEEEEEESDMYNNMKWDIDGKKFDVEGEMGKEKCQRISRCKESGQGNKVFCDWRKPLWVATS